MTSQLDGIGKIHEAIVNIMAEVGSVGKTRENKQQGYKFRGIADITLACQPIMARHHVHVTPHAVIHEEVSERKTAKGSEMLHIRQRIEFRFYHADGSYVPCVTTGEAMDTGDKTSNKCMSAALKYALTQTFCIPEDDPEADTEHASHELGARQPAKETPRPLPAAAVELLERLPADGLTDADIEKVGELAKRAGYTKHSDITPLLEAIGGVKTLRALERRFLSDLVTSLEKKALVCA